MRRSRPSQLATDLATKNERGDLLPGLLTIALQYRSETEGRSGDEPQLSGQDNGTSKRGEGREQVEREGIGRRTFEEKI